MPSKHRCTWRLELVAGEIEALGPEGSSHILEVADLHCKGDGFKRHLKSLGRNLLELRATASGNEYRLIFFHHKTGEAVGLVAFHKKSKSTPLRLINLAHKRMSRWKKSG